MIKRIDGVTYGDLDAVLQQLGFEVKEQDGDRTYVHQKSGAIVLLPLLPLTETVAAYHLVGVRGSLDLLGTIDRDDFDLLLLRHAKKRQPAVTH